VAGAVAATRESAAKSSAITSVAGTDLEDLLDSFELSLRAGNKAPRTLEVYGDSLRQLIEFLKQAGAPTDITRLTVADRGISPVSITEIPQLIGAGFGWCEG
jgi:hypothetical protein